MGEEPVIGRDVQVAIMHDQWVRPLKHPDCKYGYIGDGRVSYLVSERFIDFGENHYPTDERFWKKFKKMGLNKDKVLEAQRK